MMAVCRKGGNSEPWPKDAHAHVRIILALYQGGGLSAPQSLGPSETIGEST